MAMKVVEEPILANGMNREGSVSVTEVGEILGGRTERALEEKNRESGETWEFLTGTKC